MSRDVRHSPKFGMYARRGRLQLENAPDGNALKKKWIAAGKPPVDEFYDQMRWDRYLKRLQEEPMPAVHDQAQELLQSIVCHFC